MLSKYKANEIDSVEVYNFLSGICESLEWIEVAQD
jgi:hypothetical protein